MDRENHIRTLVDAAEQYLEQNPDEGDLSQQQFNEELQKAIDDMKPWYVNLYVYDRAYGGPEEGGWWFDVYELQNTTRVASKEEAESLQKVIQLACNEQNDNRNSDVNSVLSEGMYVVMIENHKGFHKPQERPYYE